MKKAGKGIFAVKTLSADLAAICGKPKMPRTEVTKALWAYIKKNKLSKGRTITPDAKLKKVLPAASSAGCAFRTGRILWKELKRGFCQLIRVELKFCPRVFELCRFQGMASPVLPRSCCLAG